MTTIWCSLSQRECTRRNTSDRFCAQFDCFVSVCVVLLRVSFFVCCGKEIDFSQATRWRLHARAIRISLDGIYVQRFFYVYIKVNKFKTRVKHYEPKSTVLCLVKLTGVPIRLTFKMLSSLINKLVSLVSERENKVFLKQCVKILKFCSYIFIHFLFVFAQCTKSRTHSASQSRGSKTSLMRASCQQTTRCQIS